MDLSRPLLFKSYIFQPFPAKLIQQNTWANLIEKVKKIVAALFCIFRSLSASPLLI